MYHEEQTSDAPQIYRPMIEARLRFKSKDGKFEVYRTNTKEKELLDAIAIIPISDSRFTIKPAQNTPGEFLFSGLYRSSKQRITVLKSQGGKVSMYKEGTWEELKTDPNLKYTKVLFCLLKTGDKLETAEFDLQGVAMIMWGDISKRGTDGVIALSVSPEKDFKTKLGSFHTMLGEVVAKPNEREDTEARAFAAEVKKSCESHDASYKHYQGEVPKAEASVPEKADAAIPTINLDDDEFEEVPMPDDGSVYGVDGEKVQF